jgi:cytochrome c biogenesis protein
VIRSAWSRVAAFLSSARLATVLLAFLGVWSILTTVIPQGAASSKEVADWASGHAMLEPIVHAIGLHQAFSNPLFLAVVATLGLSTAVCAWQRTRASSRKAATLHRAALTARQALVESHDLEVPYDSALSVERVLSITSSTLSRLGVKTRRHDDILVAVSPQWTVWGSPIFHWALVALVLALLIGNMLRSEGLMGVAVGQTKADTAESYGISHTGPLHSWGRVHRSIRVDEFELDYTTGGVHRGPTPTVSLLDGSGKVIKTQRVYPNHTLKSGPVTIYPSSYGLAAIVSEVTTSGAVLGSGVELIDFAANTSDGTVAIGYLDVVNSSGVPVYRATVTVPLQVTGGGRIDRLPEEPSARVVVTAPNGDTVLDRVVVPGETLAVQGAAGVRVDDIVYYARLQVVDDWTIPLLYSGLFVALVGLTIATLARQQIVLATVVEGLDGRRLVAKVRLWRNESTSRSEIQSELAKALGDPGEGTML